MLALRPACLHGPLESYQVYLSFRAEPCLTPPALPYPYFIRYLIPGGSAGHFKREGYTFDVGSSMMFGFGEQGTTNLITKCLEAVGKKMETVADPTQVSATGRSRGGACGGEGKAIGCVVSRWSGRSHVRQHNVSSHTLPALFPHLACSPCLARFPPSGLNRGKWERKRIYASSLRFHACPPLRPAIHQSLVMVVTPPPRQVFYHLPKSSRFPEVRPQAMPPEGGNLYFCLTHPMRWMT